MGGNKMFIKKYSASIFFKTGFQISWAGPVFIVRMSTADYVVTCHIEQTGPLYPRNHPPWSGCSKSEHNIISPYCTKEFGHHVSWRRLVIDKFGPSRTAQSFWCRLGRSLGLPLLLPTVSVTCSDCTLTASNRRNDVPYFSFVKCYFHNTGTLPYTFRRLRWWPNSSDGSSDLGDEILQRTTTYKTEDKIYPVDISYIDPWKKNCVVYVSRNKYLKHMLSGTQDQRTVWCLISVTFLIPRI
jgi:hypothetical protein